MSILEFALGREWEIDGWIRQRIDNAGLPRMPSTRKMNPVGHSGRILAGRWCHSASPRISISL
jgi:hypothetical protein